MRETFTYFFNNYKECNCEENKCSTDTVKCKKRYLVNLSI